MKKNLLTVVAGLALLSVGSVVAAQPTQVSAKTTKIEKVSPIPEVNRISRTKKGITYELKVAKKARVIFSYNKKNILTKKAKTSKLKVFIPAKDLKGKKGSFSIKQIQPGKKVSKAVKAKIIKVGQVQVKIV